MVAHDHFLRQPLGDVGGDAAGIFADQLDFGASRAIAMLLHIKFDAVIHLRGSVGELTGIGHDQADFHRLLGIRGGSTNE